ncbi:hypothetical protein [Candidatus Laterigemmans baculatus]|uniref:hypothetical protein n=1 Tax=Candidatus Laterigemmans baculatus TaxID=2770505 RepID=UPI0013D9FB77|nr:hypothetical protein [Candidatus Laterigemmans baculatus]
MRAEIRKLAEAIQEMDNGKLTPHEVNDRIHTFHNDASRDLWVRYTHADTSLSVARAYYDGYLTDDDLAEATPGVLEDIRHGTRLIQDEMAQEAEGEETNGDSPRSSGPREPRSGGS